MRPSFRSFQPRQAHVAEAEDDEDVDEVVDDGETQEDREGETTLEEVLQAEVEHLAGEIAEAEAEGVDPVHLEALESGIEASAEALVSVREARSKLAEVRKDRGYKHPSTTSPSATGRPKAKSASAAVAAKKASGKHVCFDRGQGGHWAGDPECKHPGAWLARPKPKAGRQVRIAEATPGHEATQVEQAVPKNEVMMAVSWSLSTALQSSLTPSSAAREVLDGGQVGGRGLGQRLQPNVCWNGMAGGLCGSAECGARLHQGAGDHEGRDGDVPLWKRRGSALGAAVADPDRDLQRACLCLGLGCPSAFAGAASGARRA